MERSTRAAGNQRAWAYVGYFVALFLVWAIVWVHIAYPWGIHHFGDASLSYALFNIIFRLTIWVLPPFLLLRRVDHVNPLEYLKLRRHWMRGVFVGIVFSAISFALTAWHMGLPHLHRSSITWNSILSTSILSGFIEEVPFRGLMLQKLRGRIGFWRSAVISSLLFAGIHVPGWILLGTLNFANVASIFVFGMILAIIFRYSKSLWAPIVSHSLNDFIAAVLYH